LLAAGLAISSMRRVMISTLESMYWLDEYRMNREKSKRVLSILLNFLLQIDDPDI
jgi:hypothetical protein